MSDDRWTDGQTDGHTDRWTDNGQTVGYIGPARAGQ